MFNILRNKGNANQNDTEIPSHPTENGYHQEKNTTTNTGEGGILHYGNVNQ
jgi:hypothetical protein